MFEDGVYVVGGIVAPIFALIALGAIAGRRGWLGPGAVAATNGCVYFLAMPALLVRGIATADEDTFHSGFLLAYGASTLALFLLTMPVGLLLFRDGLRRSAIRAFAVAFANTGFVGIPLLLLARGQEGMGPAMAATVFNNVVLTAFLIAIVEGAGGARALVLGLARNPLILASMAGGALLALEYPLIEPVDATLRLLAAAAPPLALIAAGLFLAAGRPEAAAAPSRSRRAMRLDVGLATLLKLALHPLLAWACAVPLLGLDARATADVVLMAATPMGSFGFVLAARYGAWEAEAARGILLSTLLSALTLSALVALGIVA